MKLNILSIAVLALSPTIQGCESREGQRTSVQVSKRTDTQWSIARFGDHQYVVATKRAYSAHETASIVHDPDCPCVAQRGPTP